MENRTKYIILKGKIYMNNDYSNGEYLGEQKESLYLGKMFHPQNF